MKDKRYLEWAISFWLGIGLMSIINVWKIVENQHALSYSWIMFGISIIAIIICMILIKIKKSPTRNGGY
jgi:tellurite resistance protein TehA-like permease